MNLLQWLRNPLRRIDPSKDEEQRQREIAAYKRRSDAALNELRLELLLASEEAHADDRDT